MPGEVLFALEEEGAGDSFTQPRAAIPVTKRKSCYMPHAKQTFGTQLFQLQRCLDCVETGGNDESPIQRIVATTSHKSIRRGRPNGHPGKRLVAKMLICEI